MVGRLELERRVLIAALTATCLAAVIWLVAISTTEWCSVKFDPWRFITKNNLSIGGYSIGLWRMCGRLYFNNTADGPETRCKWLKIRDVPANSTDPENDQTLIHYRRSTSAMAVIALCVSPLGIAFGAYAIVQARYMFKRVASAIIMINAATSVVTLEVFRSMIHHMNNSVKGIDWFRGEFHYGFSYAFGWVTFILLVLSSVTFLLLSGKRKREKALSEREARENEPVNIGR